MFNHSRLAMVAMVMMALGVMTLPSYQDPIPYEQFQEVPEDKEVFTDDPLDTLSTASDQRQEVPFVSSPTVVQSQVPPEINEVPPEINEVPPEINEVPPEINAQDFADDPLAEDPEEEELEGQKVMTGRERDFLTAFQKLEQQDAADGIAQDAADGIVGEYATPIAFDGTSESSEKIVPSEPISDGFEKPSSGESQNEVTEREVRKEANVPKIGAAGNQAKKAGAKIVEKAESMKKGAQAGNGGAVAKTTNAQNDKLAKASTPNVQPQIQMKSAAGGGVDKNFAFKKASMTFSGAIVVVVAAMKLLA